MKKFSIKLYTTVFLTLASFKMFATPVEDTPEDPETPINTRLLWLLVAGIAFAFYYFYNQRKKQVTK